MSLTIEDQAWLTALVNTTLERKDSEVQRLSVQIDQLSTRLDRGLERLSNSRLEMRARTHATVLRAMDAEIEFSAEKFRTPEDRKQ